MLTGPMRHARLATHRGCRTKNTAAFCAVRSAGYGPRLRAAPIAHTYLRRPRAAGRLQRRGCRAPAAPYAPTAD